ncbi:MAG: 50S ribosomal protein L6 [Fidelibacterota bacterium]
MSRIGKKIIPIPDKVSVIIKSGLVTLNGPKGSLEVPIHADMTVKQDNGHLVVDRPSESRLHRALHGTMRQLIANGVTGVSEGFSKKLEIIGVGYQAVMEAKYLVLQLGYSHPIYFEPPEGVEIKAERTIITVSGIDKQLVGEVAAKIRSFRKPEPYKGKGIRYKGEYVRSKQGKTVGGAS